MSGNLFLLIFTFPLFVFAWPQTEPTIPLDAHVHYKPKALYPDQEDGSSLFLKSQIAQKAFLISPSFQIDQNKSYPESEYRWMKNLKLRSQLDQETQEIVAKNPNRFVGLCGYNINWPDGPETVKNCISKPGMVGVKIHFDNTESFIKNSRAQLDKLFSSIRKEKPVVLWHIQMNEKMEDVYSIVKAYPEINFVFAHSTYIPENLKKLSALEKKNGKLKNLQMDISEVWNNMSSELKPEFIPAWRSFGFDRLIFGSDAGWRGKDELIQFKKIFLTDPQLRPSERQAILDASGRLANTYFKSPAPAANKRKTYPK